MPAQTPYQSAKVCSSPRLTMMLLGATTAALSARNSLAATPGVEKKADQRPTRQQKIASPSNIALPAPLSQVSGAAILPGFRSELPARLPARLSGASQLAKDKFHCHVIIQNRIGAYWQQPKNAEIAQRSPFLIEIESPTSAIASPAGVYCVVSV